MDANGYLIHRTEDDQGEGFKDPCESYDEHFRKQMEHLAELERRQKFIKKWQQVERFEKK